MSVIHFSEKEGDEKTKNDIRNLQYSVAKQLSTAIPNKKEELNNCLKCISDIVNKIFFIFKTT